MLLSACVLGYTDLSAEFISRFKKLPYYKKRDSDTEGVRIHVVHVEDSDFLERPYIYRYQKDDNYSNVLNDGDQGRAKEVCIGNDRDWLLESNGHNLIVEVSEDPDIYLDILLNLISKGYWTIITSDKFKTRYLAQITEAASASGAKLSIVSDLDSVFELLDAEYTTRLAHHRKVLMEQAALAKPCGFPD